MPGDTTYLNDLRGELNFEVTIVNTAIVSITNGLHEFAESSWVVTAYLLTYISGLAICANASDLVGRKQAILASLFIFIAFSAGCGASQTMIQLVFQGIGGSGVYAISTVMLGELVRPEHFGWYAVLATCFVALANMVGPVFGGLITAKVSWRWVFLLNIPIGVVAGALLFWAVPIDFPDQGRIVSLNRRYIRHMDFIGAALVLATIALLITGLERAATLLTWTTGEVLGPLFASAAALAALLGYQYKQWRHPSYVEPVFPWWFCLDKRIMGLLLCSFMTGAVITPFAYVIPLRYQIAAGFTPLQAGIRLLPFSLSGPLGSVLAAMLFQKRRMPPVYAMLAGSIFQFFGVFGASRGPTDDPSWAGLPGVSVITGLGVGFCVCAATVLAYLMVHERDIGKWSISFLHSRYFEPVGAAATIQFRFLGGATVVSIVTAVGNGYVKKAVSGLLTEAQIQDVFRSTESIKMLPGDLQVVVRRAFVESFNLQLLVVLAFATAGVFAVFLMWQKEQVTVKRGESQES
ncbi:hypothetical protein BBP40_012782 [Aspergillus hancockii]|nr:hypothetical protein BBP40_012782 [Aspergillus hancockii]